MSDNRDPLKGARAPSTQAIHTGRHPGDHFGFVNTPPFRGSTILFPTAASLEAGDQPFRYARRGTPATSALEESLAELEGAYSAVLTQSGLAAITTALLGLTKTGDHILVTDSVYGPTRYFCDTILARLGIETTYYDPLIGGDIGSLFKDNTRLVYTESPGSQTFEMQDIPAISACARPRDILHLTDNTWATPLYFKPFDYGVDVSIHAGTKYIAGHSDAMLGVITTNEVTAKAIRHAAGTLGMNPGSEETFLGLRGLRTMSIRLARHQASAIEIAEWFAGRPEVARVLHPGLPGDPGHAIWARDYRGSTGLFSIILHPVSKAGVHAMLDGLELFGMGYSWGGYESLALAFDPTTGRTATAWQAEGPAVRFHIGLEEPCDLMYDLERGFERMANAANS